MNKTETIEVNLNDFSRDALITLIQLSCEWQEPVSNVIVDIIERYVTEYINNPTIASITK